MNIRSYYLEAYPGDDMGPEINKEATFLGLFAQLVKGNNVYDYLGASDSLIRERVFDKLAKLLNEPYDFIYNLWLYNPLLKNE